MEYYILEDVNIKYNPCDVNKKYSNQKWSDITIKYGLEQLINHLTRVSKLSSSIIDHIETTNVNHISDIFISELSLFKATIFQFVSFVLLVIHNM